MFASGERSEPLNGDEYLRAASGGEPLNGDEYLRAARGASR